MRSAKFAIKRLIAERIQKNRERLWNWQLAHAKTDPPPFYCSVDLRDSGHKIVPVDSNLFPAGFNNICQDDLRAAPKVVLSQLENIAARQGLARPRRVLLIPEAHTHNHNYIENLYYLVEILKDTGLEPRLGWHGAMPDGATDRVALRSATEKELIAYPIDVKNGILSAGDFVPDLIVLNNDFSGGYPTLFDSIHQPVIPSHRMGWHSRKKSEHFQHYNQLAEEFAAILEIDPWILKIDTEEVSPVSFDEGQGAEEVARSVERVLARTREAYAAHNVSQVPFAFVKNNAGTYGMGVMVVRSPDEVLKMNRRTKNKMSVGKNHSHINSVVIQEGIPTATIVDRLAAEPVIYLVGTDLIGGFLRTNTERGTEENLNSQGMVFRKLCMSELWKPDREPDEDNASASNDKDYVNGEPILELVYGSIARLSALAAGRELSASLARSRQAPRSLPSAEHRDRPRELEPQQL